MSELLTVEQKRQAIARGLSPYMNGNTLKNVLDHWESEYGDKPSFVLNRFVTEICTTDELRFFRKDILKKVLSEIGAIEKQILLNPVKGTPFKEVEFNQQTELAFQFFMQEVFKTVHQTIFTNFDADFQKILQQYGIEILSHTKGTDKLFLDYIVLSDFPKVITALYETYCDYFGPPKADQLYAQLRYQLKLNFPYVDIQKLL